MSARRTISTRIAVLPLVVALAVGACATSTRAVGNGGSGDALASTARGCPTVDAPAAAVPPAHVSDPRVALREICAMMRRSAARWTAGDLDTFMGDYMPGEGTTYIGRRGVVRGPEAIRAGYAPRFAPGGVHDSLSFEDVEVDLLAPDLANTIAYYVLSRGDSTIARGPTSLVMRRVEGRWRIVHDHSS